MIGPEDRQMAMKLLDEAIEQGARLESACEVLGLSARTVQRWRAQESPKDRRTQTLHAPTNKLTEQEREAIIEVANENQWGQCNLIRRECLWSDQK